MISDSGILPLDARRVSRVHEKRADARLVVRVSGIGVRMAQSLVTRKKIDFKAGEGKGLVDG